MTTHQIDPLSVSLICHVQLHPRRRAFQHHEWANSFAFPLFPRSIGSRSCVTNDSSLPQLILISMAWSNQESESTAHIFNYYFLHGILISTTSRLTPEIRKVSVKVRQLLPRKIQWQPIALLYIYIYIYIMYTSPSWPTCSTESGDWISSPRRIIDFCVKASVNS